MFSVLGYHFGDVIVRETSETAVALFQALVAGSLLHVILRHPPSLPSANGGTSPAATKVASGIGGVLGILLVYFLGRLGLHEGHGHSHGHAHGALSMTRLRNVSPAPCA